MIYFDNIFEYKSPTDYIAIDDYYKVKAYAYLYKALSKETNSIDISELTITLTSNRYPKKLIEYLKEKQGIIVNKVDSGIYYIENTDIKTQLIVTRELSDKEAVYLKVLQKEHENKNSLKIWLNEYLKNTKNPLYAVIMDVLAEANPNEVMEVYKNMGKAQLSNENIEFLMELVKNSQLYNKLKDEGKKEGIKEGEIIGKADSIIELLSDIGDVPKELKEVIYKQNDIEKLMNWIKIAAKCESIDEFKSKIMK